MSTTFEGDLTVIRHETDRMTSVYRGTTHLGLVLPIYAFAQSEPEIFEARFSAPMVFTRRDAVFNTEQKAIDHLASPDPNAA